MPLLLRGGSLFRLYGYGSRPPSLLLLSPLLRAFVLPVPVRCAAILDTGVVLLGFTFGDESKSEFPNFF